MIESFADKNAELIWNGQFAKKLPREIQEPAREVLRILHAFNSFNDFQAVPSLHAHKLGGDRQSTWSFRINKQWRLTFIWIEERSAAQVVRIEDYH